MFAEKDLAIESVSINIDSRFRGLEGLRILHFSDLHLRNKNKKFDRVFAHLSRVECDLAVCSGDLIDHDYGINACVEYLASLSPKYGTYVTYGNHDKYQLGLKELIFFSFFYSANRIKPNNLGLLSKKLSEKAIKVLDNDLVRLDIKGTSVALIGIDCPLGYDRLNDPGRFEVELLHLKSLISSTLPEDYVIIISHVPDLLKELYLKDIDLILSSHTHGGQIRLPFFGPLFSLSSFQRKYSRGIFQYRDSYLHVSSGLGMTNTTPLRLGCPPSVTVIKLNSTCQQQQRKMRQL